MCNSRPIEFLTSRSRNVLRKYSVHHCALSFDTFVSEQSALIFRVKMGGKMLIRNNNPRHGTGVTVPQAVFTWECHSYATRTVTSAMYIKSDQTHHPLIAMSFLSINFTNCWSSFLFPLTVIEMFWWVILDVDCGTQ